MRQLIERMGLSQPTLSRALLALGEEVLRIGRARSIQYALRDSLRGASPIYRVDTEGHLRALGTLAPVRPDGFVMQQADGVTVHSEGLPWWLFNMRPQGYLGRAYAARHGAALGLPDRLADWTDTHVLRALLTQGHEAVGNLLVGDVARTQFLAAPRPDPIAEAQKGAAYTHLALEAAQGELPGSSAGGEQPKFVTYALTPSGARHVIVKFSEAEESPVSERWRDLLLAEHLALDTLCAAGISAAQTRVLDYGSQRFLEVVRFDRVGEQGRRALISLEAMDAEFVGLGTGRWPLITQRLALDGHIRPEAAHGAALLWAFGSLIGNTDMHNGNLSFVSDHGQPYELAPAYDMTPMGFSPRSGGGLPDTLAEATVHASVPNETWRQAEALARRCLARVRLDSRFSRRFAPCIAAIGNHIDAAAMQIARLG
jgi:hypothetical protein